MLKKNLQKYMIKTVFPSRIDQDRYGLSVAEAFSKDQSVGLQLIRGGFAVAYGT
jgi:endonuclease YncB( thermonuclease family)